MMDVLFLAWRYLAYHRLKTSILVASVMLIVYLPIGLNVLVGESARQLTSRAASTPLLIGAKGSPLELVLRSLYFESDAPPMMRYGELDRVTESGFGRPIPVHCRFRTVHGPIVGTSLDYFPLRGLEVARGRQIGLLGECVLGSRAAQLSNLGPGDSIMSTPESVFDIAGAYPLKMNVVGVLKATGTPDDHAVFVDIKTAWVIEGLAHGHEELDSSSEVLRQDGNEIVANASVRQYNEVTAENISTFHFHGDVADFPMTAVIAVPHDQRSSTLLQGRYLGDDELVQIVNPTRVMDELLATIMTVRRYVLMAMGVVALATLATMTLVFLLSFELRRREMETMVKIGATPNRIAALVATEILGVLAAGSLLAGLLSLGTGWLASAATQWLIRI